MNLRVVLLLFISPILLHSNVVAGQWQPSVRRVNINNISTAISNDGWSDRNRSSGGADFFFPRRTGRTAMLQSGLVWGAKTSDALHVGGSTHVSGLQPGRILSPGNHEDPALLKNRMYRVRPDYATADLSVEASEEQLTEEQVRPQYEEDWNQWPAVEGAPFDDRNGNGVYEAGIDIPGIRGAGQTLWFVANDLDSARTQNLYGTNPLGMEMQVTVWAYANAGALDNVVYKRYRLINKSAAPFDSLFVCQWSDPDVGNAGDDFVGCDTTLDMTYAYNAGPVDQVYTPFPGPAAGHRLINADPVGSFFLSPDGPYKDPPYSEDGARMWYFLLQGLTPITGAPYVHSSFPNDSTRFWLDGDPVGGTGRRDGLTMNPGNRRMGISAGPFLLQPGDSLELVVATIAALGGTHISCIADLRSVASVAQSNYGSALSSGIPAPALEVEYPNPFQAEIQLRVQCKETGIQSVTASLWREDNTIVTTIPLFDDGLHDDGMTGDNLWGNGTIIVRETGGLFLRLVVLDSLNRNILWERLLEHIATLGPVETINPRVFSDNLTGDGIVNPGENIRYGFSVANNGLFEAQHVRAMPLSGEVGYFQLSTIASGLIDSLTYNPNDPASYGVFTAPDSGAFTIHLLVADTNQNEWRDSIRFVVVPFPASIHGTPLLHTAGRSEWEFRVLVVDSSSVVGHQYEISIVDSIDAYRTPGFNLRDVISGSMLLSNHPFPAEASHNIPVTDGFKILRGQQFDLYGLRDDSTRWISQYAAWFQGDRFDLDPHSAFEGGVTTGYQLGVHYLGSFESSFEHRYSIPVEVRFDPSVPQKAYRLRRISQYVISEPDPFTNVPFTVWDVSDPASPRQLTLAWRDENSNGVWDPQINNDGSELVFIYNKSYDPTGATQFAMPPNAIPNECTVGPHADVVYGLSLAVRSGHSINENPGALYLRPYYPLVSGDLFTFNPSIVLSAGEDAVPLTFNLFQNYPNPFNPSTTISFIIPHSSLITLKVFNVLGQHVATLLDEVREPGQGFVQWNGTNASGRNVASGVYFYQLRAGSSVLQRKMLLIK